MSSGTEYDKAFHSGHKTFNPNIVDKLKEKCFAALKHSQANLSNVHVASCVLAKDKNGVYEYFTGVNIELTTQTGVHAEVCALFKAISEGYTDIIMVAETSDNIRACKPLCGQCRYFFSAVNPHIAIVVFDPEGNRIFRGILSDLEKEAYFPTKRIT